MARAPKTKAPHSSLAPSPDRPEGAQRLSNSALKLLCAQKGSFITCVANRKHFIPNLDLLWDPEPPQTPLSPPRPTTEGKEPPHFNELLAADGAWEERWAVQRSRGWKLHLAPGSAGRTEFIEGSERPQARPASVSSLPTLPPASQLLGLPPARDSPQPSTALVFILIKGSGHAGSPCHRSLSLQLASFGFY